MAMPFRRSTCAAIPTICSNSVEPVSSPSTSRQEPSPDNLRRAIPAAFTIPYTPLPEGPSAPPLFGKSPHHHTGLGGGGAGGLGDGGSMASGTCVSGDDGTLRMVGG
ncbi:hypothetical protein S40285_10254 [Stachybotrys chlorohalonatus IBT 40285]|uniref:Uncharacterized protein n=1 Tax=Stachybotrys chlorohalonatus (strain IBT 40285) TaxID=1283841 RepID=A0A084QGZ0_STAC4|nr:hypothetical protein S40285_10254 [Stachybotrys chlorohalonata IBT 40285]